MVGYGHFLESPNTRKHSFRREPKTEELTIIINNKYYYWARLSKILWFFSGEEITYLQKLKAEARNWSTGHLQLTNYNIYIFYLWIFYRVCFLINIFGKESDLP